MKIDLSKMKHFWWEDEQGNILDLPKYGSPSNEQKEQYCFYHSEFPCQISHEISHYGYHPTKMQRFLIKLPIIGKRVKQKIGKTFRSLGTFNTTYTCGGDCIVAMVNSGDYTLEQAIWVYTHSCERCMNVLEFKYLKGKEGYAEYSDEWLKCNTVCDFCKEDKQ